MFNNTRIMFLFILSILFFSCSEKKINSIQFKISGITDSIYNGSYVFLANDELLDSVQIVDNRFDFMGTVKSPTYSRIFIKATSETKWFWLENTKISFFIPDHDFSNAMVKGGKAQEMANLHYTKNESLFRSIDSLYNVYSIKVNELSLEEKGHIRALSRSLSDRTIKNTQDFVRTYPNCYESILTLNANRRSWGSEMTDNLFSKMADSIKETKYGKLLKRYLSLHSNLEIGDNYIDFEQENMYGEIVKFSDLKKKYTLIEFWASWCIPCRESNPKLMELHRKYNKDGFEIVAISLDENKQKWIDAIKKDQLEWINLTDYKFNDNAAAIIYNVNGIPDNILIDEEGVIVNRKVDAKTLEVKLESDLY
ncbi:thiol-disulfide isomerase/thioredoxin [Arenibacter algicola]|uniref:Thiol-disulfide isomerase/thioredoxin n=2 Tax=Arenibacter algicola TaxID=616991 RepID=A0ABY3ABH0_9FLAO